MHVYPVRDIGSEQIAAKVFDKRAVSGLPAASGSSAASAVTIADAGGYFTGTDVEAALQELGAGTAGMPVGAQIGYARTVSTTTASTTETTIPADGTIPQNTEGVAYSSLDTTLTVQSAASLIEVELIISCVSCTVASLLRFAIFRDSEANAICSATQTVPGAGGFFVQNVMRFIYTAGSTGAKTFKLRWCTQAGTAYLLNYAGTNYFGASNVATLTVREIKQ